MAEAEQFKPKEDLLFEGKKLDCKKELLNEDVFVYGGYWKYEEFDNKVAVKGRGQLKIKVKKEAAIRKIKNEDCLDDWKHTADQLLNLNHYNILRLFGYEEDVANGLRYFALEPYTATLFHYCNGMYKGPMPNKSQVLYQITNGINHLHTKEIIHGNLNPLNVVIAAQSRPVRMKISDSGLSTFSYSKQLPETAEQSFDVRASWKRKSLELCQSKYWTLRGETNVIEKHIDDDNVAAGCILFYYLTRGEHLFGDDSKSILKNLKDKIPVNLKRLRKDHIEHKLIQDMIIPPSNGLNVLQIANEKFKEALSLQVNTDKPLGNGTFGDVYEGTFRGDPVAVKQMKTTTSIKKYIQREMSKHLELDHVNVVKLFDVSDSADNIFTYMALELCAGTLKDFCENKYNGPMPPDELVLYQIANGLHYIHSRDLVHRDIKPDNILISMTTPVQMKVSDLSFVKKTTKDIFSQSEIRGALLWMAPERLIFKDDPSKMPAVLPDGTIKSDAFSSGCVFFYFLTRGLHPFGDSVHAPSNIVKHNPVEFVNYMKNNKIGGILADLIEGMIKGNEEERTGLPEVIQQLATRLSLMDQIKCQLRDVKMPLDENYYFFSFHLTKAILACASKKELIFFTAENSSIPFSNWRKQVKSLPRDLKPSSVTALEWNMDGTQLAVGYHCHTLVVWNYRECEILFQKKHSAEIDRIKWNPTRPNVLATFSKDKENVSLWNSSTGDVITTINSGRVSSVKWISGNLIAVSSIDSHDDGFIHIFEMDESHATTRIVKQFIPDEWTWEIKWNERTQYLASCGGNEIKILSMDSDEPIYCLKAEQRIRRFAWRPCVRNENQLDGIEMARTSSENFTFVYIVRHDGGRCCLYIWNPLENAHVPRLLSDKNEIDNLTFSSDGRFLAAHSYKELIIWSAKDWKPIYKHHHQHTSITRFSWLNSTTSTNIYEKKLIKKSSANKIAQVLEFAFDYEEYLISDSDSKTSIESEDTDVNDDDSVIALQNA